MSSLSDVTNHVRRYRRSQDLTQEQLADRLGVTRQTVLSIERGRYNPSVVLALRMARVLDLPVEALFELKTESDDG